MEVEYKGNITDIMKLLLHGNIDYLYIYHFIRTKIVQFKEYMDVHINMTNNQQVLRNEASSLASIGVRMFVESPSAVKQSSRMPLHMALTSLLTLAHFKDLGSLKYSLSDVML